MGASLSPKGPLLRLIHPSPRGSVGVSSLPRGVPHGHSSPPGVFGYRCLQKGTKAFLQQCDTQGLMTESVTIPEHEAGVLGTCLEGPEPQLLFGEHMAALGKERRCGPGEQGAHGKTGLCWPPTISVAKQIQAKSGMWGCWWVSGYLKPDLLIRGVCMLSDSFLILMSELIT